jgi:ribosomal protein L19
MKTIDIFCVFPEAVDATLRVGVVSRAIEHGAVGLRTFGFRDFISEGRIDDSPYGGGAGMVLRVDVVARALESVYGVPAREVKEERRVVITEPAGRKMSQSYVEEVSGGSDLTLICGRYGGVDSGTLFCREGRSWPPRSRTRCFGGSRGFSGTPKASWVSHFPGKTPLGLRCIRGLMIGMGRVCRACYYPATMRKSGAGARARLGRDCERGRPGEGLPESVSPPARGEPMITSDNLQKRATEFKPGDTVRVQYRVTEGNRERLQAFEGLCIARKGAGIHETFTVRKNSFGVDVERIFPVHSPKIADIEMVTRGAVRRAKLYYIREKVGKQARVKRAR